MKKRFNGNTASVEWHKPECTLCRAPIEKIEDAYAGWYEDGECRTHSPQLVHVGESGCRYYHRFPNGHLKDEHVLDLPVHWLRRVPMEAICIAMRRRAETEAERITWHAWLSAILGLPFSGGEDLASIAFRNATGSYVAQRVLTAREAASDIGQPFRETARFRGEPEGAPIRFKIVALYRNDAEREVHSGSLPEINAGNEPLNVDVSVDGERWNFYLQRIGKPRPDGSPF